MHPMLMQEESLPVSPEGPLPLRRRLMEDDSARQAEAADLGKGSDRSREAAAGWLSSTGEY